MGLIPNLLGRLAVSLGLYALLPVGLIYLFDLAWWWWPLIAIPLMLVALILNLRLNKRNTVVSQAKGVLQAAKLYRESDFYKRDSKIKTLSPDYVPEDSLICDHLVCLMLIPLRDKNLDLKQWHSTLSEQISALFLARLNALSPSSQEYQNKATMLSGALTNSFRTVKTNTSGLKNQQNWFVLRPQAVEPALAVLNSLLDNYEDKGYPPELKPVYKKIAKVLSKAQLAAPTAAATTAAATTDAATTDATPMAAVSTTANQSNNQDSTKSTAPSSAKERP